MVTFTKISLLFIIILSGCSNQPTDTTKHNDIYKHGFQDGCDTANGIYTKNHKLFENSLDYHEGWFNGRKKCNH